MSWLISFLTFLTLTAPDLGHRLSFLSLARADGTQYGPDFPTEVSEAVRRQQAREILGELHSRSPAASALGMDLNLYIHATVEDALATQWKSQAPEISATILRESQRYLFDPVLILALIQTESSFRPHVRGRHGEIGLMQLQPATGRWIAGLYNLPWNGPKTLLDPHLNIRIGAAYLHFLRQKFASKGPLYVAAYNMGPSALRSRLKENQVPEAYRQRIIRHYVRYYEGFAQTHLTKAQRIASKAPMAP